MGQDIILITKEKVETRDGDRSREHYGIVDRGLCVLIQNAQGHSPSVMNEAEKALNVDLSFLLEPAYFDPSRYSDEEMKEFLGMTNETLKQAREEGESGWVAIEPFLEKLYLVREKISAGPGYERKMDYDRKWWERYFIADFENDIEALVAFLEEIKAQGQKEFSFDFD